MSNYGHMNFDTISSLPLSGFPVRVWMTDLELRLVTSIGSPGLDQHFSTSGIAVSGREEVAYDVEYPQHPDVFAHLRARNGERVTWRTGPEGRIHACVAPIFSADKQVTGIIGFAVDYGREADEERRRRSVESLLRHLLQAFPSPVSVMDGDGRVMLVNAAYLHAVGKSEDEVVARSEQPPVPALPSPAHGLPDSPMSTNHQSNWIGANGESFQSQIVSVKNAGGMEISLHVASDLTREEALRVELEKYSRHFDLIFDVAGRPLAILGDAGEIEQANRAFAGILNVSKGKLLGTSIDRWIGASSRTNFGVIRRSVQAGDPSRLNGVLLQGENAPGLLANISAFRFIGLGDSSSVLIAIDEVDQFRDQTPTTRASLAVQEIDARILELLAAGHSNSEISFMLRLSRQGLDYRLKLLRVQLDASSRGELVARAYSLGLFSISQWPPVCRRPEK
ncbi:PAS domain-containing protein [Streptomyces sp. NPDC005533]|uniref:PAS domain-containing protein n=1 Tax=Streptomyces sp. NPDC005533 TaxID=3364723 RepID=UPI0036C0109D